MLGPIRRRAGGEKRRRGVSWAVLEWDGEGRVGSWFLPSLFSSPFYASETGCEGGNPRICVKEGE